MSIDWSERLLWSISGVRQCRPERLGWVEKQSFVATYRDDEFAPQLLFSSVALLLESGHPSVDFPGRNG